MSYSIYSSSVVQKIFQKVTLFNLIYIDEENSINIINMAIKSIHTFIFSEISPYIDFNLIEDLFIDICIGEYLHILNSCSLTHLILNFDASLSYSLISSSDTNNIKTIKEGDTSITYFESNSSSSISSIIAYFLSKKTLLHNFKEIKW